jgi:hypothetical protein
VFGIGKKVIIDFPEYYEDEQGTIVSSGASKGIWWVSVGGHKSWFHEYELTIVEEETLQPGYNRCKCGAITTQERCCDCK